MPRYARIVIPGVLHHVTQRGNRREQMFFSDADRIFFLELLAHYTLKSGVGIADYCLMPNHTHLLVVPTDAHSLGKTFKPLHMRYSQHLNLRFQRKGINWQGRYFSAPLDESHMWRAFQYVALNPVRAGLCGRPSEYRWSGARAHFGLHSDHMLTANHDWLRLGANALRDVEKPLSEQAKQDFDRLRKTTRMNLPCGSTEFVRKLEDQYARRLTPGVAGRKRKEIGERP